MICHQGALKFEVFIVELLLKIKNNIVRFKFKLAFISLFLVALPSICVAFFDDINKDHIYYQPLYFLKSNNIVVGYPDNTYKPQEYLVRAIAAKIVLSAYENDANYKLQIPDLDGTITYKDIPHNAWFSKYMVKAEEFGVLGRDADGNFKPNAPITRAEFMKLVMEPSGLDLEAFDDTQLFADIPTHAWFAKYMNFAGTFGLIAADKGNNLRPSDLVSRGEAAETGYLLYLMLKKENTDMVIQELEANIDQTQHYLTIGKGFAARRSAAIAMGLGQHLSDTDNNNKKFQAYGRLAKGNAYGVNYHILNQVKAPNAEEWLKKADTELAEAEKLDKDLKNSIDKVKNKL